MYCTNCGVKLEDNAKVCDNCKTEQIEKQDCLDEVIKEIEQEMYAIPKDDIIRSIVSVLCLLVIFIWLIFWA